MDARPRLIRFFVGFRDQISDFYHKTFGVYLPRRHDRREGFDGGIVWRKDPRVTGDAQADQELATAVRTIVASRVHEVAIAIVAPNFRRSLRHPPTQRT